MKKHILIVLKEGLLSFVGAHPRLTTVLAGIGITIAFGSIGRVAVHEALTSGTAGIYPMPTTSTELPPVSGVQYAHAAFLVSCAACGASEFTPGHEAISPGDAQNFSPGHEANSEIPAKDFAPGQIFKKDIK